MNVLIPRLQEVNRCLNDLISSTGGVSVYCLLFVVAVTLSVLLSVSVIYYYLYLFKFKLWI